MGKIQGNIYQVDKEPLINIPIIYNNDKRKGVVISLVDKIIAKKHNDITADISALEAEIDRMVYGLTDDEIKIVEEHV